MPIPKFMGRDMELSTTGLKPNGESIHSAKVTRQVLKHIATGPESVGGRVWTRRSTWEEPSPTWGGDPSPYSSSWGSAYSWDAGSDSYAYLRHWTSAGQCYYSDMGHCECCTGETKDPIVLAAQCLSTLRVLEAARARAEAGAEDGTVYALTTANVDITKPGISWGTHFNVSVEEELWEDLFDTQRPSRLGFVASAMAALIPFFGAGYVLRTRTGPRFALSGRAHHLTRLATLPTTEPYKRGLLNSRREPHANGEDRLHLIGFDLAPCSSALLASTLQCCLAAAEMGFGGLCLYEPVRATLNWSLGLDLKASTLRGEAKLATGGSISLPAYMRELVTVLLEMCRDGSISEDVAPRASALLPGVLELTHFLEEGSLGQAAVHLDWAAKLLVLADLCEREDMDLDDLPIRIADHDFASSDPHRGDFWRLWESGRIDPLVKEEEVEACLVDGPEDGRGWARGRLINAFCERITDLDWSYVELRKEKSRWASRARIEMARPGSLPRQRFEPIMALADDIGELQRLCALGEGSHEDCPEHHRNSGTSIVLREDKNVSH